MEKDKIRDIIAKKKKLKVELVRKETDRLMTSQMSGNGKYGISDKDRQRMENAAKKHE